LATGVAPHGNPPIHWDEETNIRWKVPIPGKGLATPVIWGDQIFILTAIPTEKSANPQKIEEAKKTMPEWQRRMGANAPEKFQKFTILSISRNNGHILWGRSLNEALPHAGTHRDGSWASNSPVTDGEHVFAFFGSYGLYCLDMAGNLIWQKDFGDMTIRASFGEGSSPYLYKDNLVVNWDHEGDSFITVLDKTTGKEIWKRDRDEVTSWSTPIVVEFQGKPQVIINASGKVRGYSLASGEVLWESGGMTLNVIPSPVYEDGKVFVMSGFRGNALQAIRLDKADGDLSGSDAIVWAYDRDTPYTPSPLLYDGFLYFLKGNNEILSCFTAESGESCYGPETLEEIDDIYASPVGASERVYIAGRNGVTYVIKKGATFEILSVNRLNEGFDASPLIVGNELYLRGYNSLYCIVEE
jgi:outer membrane protein assembly factor BamB